MQLAIVSVTLTSASTTRKSTTWANRWTLTASTRAEVSAKTAATTRRASIATSASPAFIGPTTNRSTPPTCANVTSLKIGKFNIILKLILDLFKACECDVFYSTGNCAEGSGQCECRPEYLSPNCDQCSLGFYGYPQCRPCDCHVNGTRDRVCEVGGGQCPCKYNYAGNNCDQCAEGYFNFPECSRKAAMFIFIWQRCALSLADNLKNHVPGVFVFLLFLDNFAFKSNFPLKGINFFVWGVTAGPF